MRKADTGHFNDKTIEYIAISASVAFTITASRINIENIINYKDHLLSLTIVSFTIRFPASSFFTISSTSTFLTTYMRK